MTKKELISLLNTQMLNSIRERDMTDEISCPEEYSYFNGQYHAFESVIDLLSSVQLENVRIGDSRRIER